MMSLTATIAMLLFTPVSTPPEPSSGPIRAPCDVSVQFGSYAMGIDGRAFDRVERYADRPSRLIAGSAVTAWGREGERTVCLTTTSRRATHIVFADIRNMLRGKGQRGPIELRTEDGRVWRSDPGHPGRAG
ncbi:MAG: hypothetical protein Q8L66_14215 [Caulobacter sp.]|nr:hypothetical protein [Caulobacter sp.]